MYGMEVSFKVSALKNKIFISWLVVVLVLGDAANLLI